MKPTFLFASLLSIHIVIASPSRATDTDSADTVVSDTAVADSSAVSEAQPLRAEIAPEKMPKISVTVDPREAAIGDLIVWRVEAERRIGDRVILPTAIDFGSLEIAGKSDTATPLKSGFETQVLEVRLLAFETGDYEIPPLKLTVVDVNGNISEVLTAPFQVVVKSLIANAPEPKIKEDKGQGEEVWVDDYTLLYIAGGIAGVALIIALTLLIRRLWSLRRPKPALPPPPPRPAEEIALEKLRTLACSGYLAEGLHKQYHLVLSETFREYLGNRFGFDALEMSTQELQAFLRSSCPIPMAVGVEIQRLLEDTDLVKFARFIPAVEESSQLLNEAVRIVNVTTPVREQNAVQPDNSPGADERGPHA